MNKKSFLTILAALFLAILPASAQYIPQYAMRAQSSTDSRFASASYATDSYISERSSITPAEVRAIMQQDEYFTTAETTARAYRMKNTGIGLLCAGGALSATGIVLYGIGVGGLDNTCAIAGLTTFAAAVPFYVAGAVLYCKGKKEMNVVATPSGLAINF